MHHASSHLNPIFDIIPVPCTVVQYNDGLGYSFKDVNNAFLLFTNASKTTFAGENITAFFSKIINKKDILLNNILSSLNTVLSNKKAHTITNLNLSINQNDTQNTRYNITHTPMLNEHGLVQFVLQSFTKSAVAAPLDEKLEKDNIILASNAIDRIRNNQAAIINSTDDVIFSIDKNFKLVTINTSYQQLIFAITGRLEQEGDTVFTGKLGKEITEKWKNYFLRAFKGEKFSIQETIFNPLKGYNQYGLINFNPVFNANGEVDAVACFAKDITNSTVNYLELEKSKVELEKIFSASLDVICAVNDENHFVKVSPASKAVWGYEPEEMIGRSIFDFIHPDYIDSTLLTIEKIKNSTSSTHFENKYIKKDGSIVTIEWNASRNVKEQLRYGVARDITEKKKIELELLESNLRYNLVTKATSDAVYDWDIKKNAVFVSDIFTDVFGWTIEQFQAQNNDWTNFIHPDDREKIVKYISADLAGNATKWRYEYRLLKPNNQFVHVVDKAFIIRNATGDAIRIVGAKRDVTKRVEELLRLKLLESVITNTNDAVVISEAQYFDESGPRIIYANEAYTKLTGYNLNEIIGKTPSILQGPKTDKKELERLKRSLQNSEPCEMTLINYKKNGEEYWVNISVNPVTDEMGKVTHWVSLQRDVTDKKQQEINVMKAIIKTQEDERYEIGGELHDNVCQILTSCQISLKMLKKYLPETNQSLLAEGIDAITLATNEIRNLSHRLAPAFFTDTTIEEAFTNLVRTFNIENKFYVSIQFDDAFKQQSAKREFQLNIYRILQEQLKNILKHAQATTITITGKVENQYLILEIKDNGVGFDVNNIKSGIGIANMKRRTELFSGKFNIQSAINKGCTLTVEVPVKEII